MKNPYTTVETMLVTERAMDLKDQNKYIFKVATGANKIEIKNAIEKLYEVKVKSVNIMNCLGKPKRAGKMMKPGKRPDSKKAVVTLSKGSIEII